MIDGYLRRLASQDTRCRLVLGRLTHAFLGLRAHHAPGFARVDDYARERLVLAARTLEGAAAVANRLATLPLVTQAFEAGILTWAHVRLLARVATPEAESRWVDIARTGPCGRSRHSSGPRIVRRLPKTATMSRGSACESAARGAPCDSGVTS